MQVLLVDLEANPPTIAGPHPHRRLARAAPNG